MPVCAIALVLMAAPHAGEANEPTALAPAQAQRLTQDKDNLWNLSDRVSRDPRYTRQQWMVAVLRRNPQAFVLGNIHRLRTSVPLVLPTDAEIATENQQVAEALIVRHLNAADSGIAMPALPMLGVTRDSPAALPAAEPTSVAGATSAPSGTPSETRSEPAAAASAPASAVQQTAKAAPAIATPASENLSGAAGTRQGFDPARTAQYGLAALVAFGSLAWIWRRSRRQGTDFGETISTLFQDTVELIRRSRLRVPTVSTAAADMARSVERLAATAELVRPAHATPARQAATSEGECDIRLEMARALSELGRTADARLSLQTVERHGTAAQRQTAQRLLATLSPAA